MKKFGYLEQFPNLPDRPELREVYAKADELKTNFHWDRVELYKQWAKNRDGKMVLIPIYAYLSPLKGPAVWFETMVHGFDESAPVQAYKESIPLIAKYGKDFPVVFIPALNPGGYVENIRFFRNETGHPTRCSVCDFDHLVQNTNRLPLLRPRANIASNIFSYQLGESLLKILARYPCFLSVDGHEDWEQRGKTHVYDDSILGMSSPMAWVAVSILLHNGFAVRMNTHNHSQEKTVNGVSTMDTGGLDNLLAAGVVFKNGIPHLKPAAWSCISMETQSWYSNHPVNMEKRIAAHSQLIEAVPYLLQMMIAEPEVYYGAANRKGITLVEPINIGPPQLVFRR